MRARALVAAIATTLSAHAVATDQLANGYVVPSITDIRYYNPAPIRYSDNERRSVKQAKRQQARAVAPALAANGAVSFQFGAATPTVVCAPLRICDIALQPGESVRKITIGDSARWLIEPMMSGSGRDEQTHAIIKATDSGLATNLIIATDRRVYHIDLKSAREDHMPYVVFTYPGATVQSWDQLIAAQRTTGTAAPIDSPEYALSAEDLNFGYRVSGEVGWKPTRVYDDGVKTYIDLPEAVQVGEAPVLLVRDVAGAEVANYRLKQNRFVIDGLVDEVLLLKGVGRKQQRVVIRRAS